MGDKNKNAQQSRRDFFSAFLRTKNKEQPYEEKVKMLTADGRLVEVNKSALAKASKNQKATNKEIFHWMKNPSKDNS